MPSYKNAWILGKGPQYFAGYVYFPKEKKMGPAFSQVMNFAWLFPSGEAAAQAVHSDPELKGFQALETTILYTEKRSSITLPEDESGL